MADFRLQGFCQSQFTKIAAEKAKVAAEEYFKLGNIDRAIQQGFAALDLNPELRIVQKYLCKEMNMDDTKVLYSILFIEDCSSVDAATIKKHYKEVVLLVHPDKNDSVAAEGAFKIVHQAWEILLSDHNKRRRKA
ncbi:DnaJ domain - like 10 [Theobroma cacao]|nr:DnaJ domain - like 10 [Theobroma cacao]